MIICRQNPHVLAYYCQSCQDFHFEGTDIYLEHLEHQSPAGLVKLHPTRHPKPEIRILRFSKTSLSTGPGPQGGGGDRSWVRWE